MTCQVAAGPFWGSTSDLQLRLMDCISSRWPVSGREEGSWRTVPGVSGIMGSIIFHFNFHFTSIHKSNDGCTHDYFGRGFR